MKRGSVFVKQSIFVKCKKIICIFHSPISFLADVDTSWHTRGLCAACQVHCVAEEAVARHTIADNSGHHLARMDANCHLLR